MTGRGSASLHRNARAGLCPAPRWAAETPRRSAVTPLENLRAARKFSRVVEARHPARGFTLIEVSVAIALLAMLMTFVYAILGNTVRVQEVAHDRLEAPKIANAVLDQVIKDLRFLYYRAGQLPGDSGFWGRDRKVASTDGDRMDFLTTRTNRVATLEDASGPTAESPLGEVGYACRASDEHPGLLELWRREDYFVDDDPTDGGTYSLVYDRIKSFDLRYYPLPEENTLKDGEAEWDSRLLKKVPYAIILTMHYYLKDVTDLRSKDPPEPQKVLRILLLKPARSLPADAGMGMDSGMGMR